MVVVVDVNVDAEVDAGEIVDVPGSAIVGVVNIVGALWVEVIVIKDVIVGGGVSIFLAQLLNTWVLTSVIVKRTKIALFLFIASISKIG